MILGTSSKCLAAKLLLIFTWCDIVYQVICSGCIAGSSYSGSVIGGSSSSSPVSSFLNGGHYIGGTGSFLILMTFLCINFQDVNSMSLPRQQLNKLSGFSKQGSAKKRSSKKDGKKKKKKKKTKAKSEHKAKSTESPETNDEEESKLISLPGIPTPSTSSSGINNRNGVSSVLPAQHQNVYSKDSRASPSLRDNKRKSDRLGQNANAVGSGSALAAASSIVSGSSLMGSIFMNENEEEALRRKILAKIEDLDPMMCLPKVLCGYSNRRRHKHYSNFPVTTTTTTTPRPILAESLIDEYMKLLKIIRPELSGEEEEQADNSKKNGKKKNQKKKKRKKTKKKKVEESEEDSEESEESYEAKKAVRKTKPKAKKSSLETDPDEEDEDGDNGEEDDDEEYDEEEMIEFNDEHVKHVKNRARMQKLMDKSGEYSDENWWTDLDDNNLKLPLSYEPPTKSAPQNGGGWLSSMMNVFSPLVRWGLGGSKDEGDDFKDDPFFLDSRSLKGGESRSLKSNGKLPTFPFSIRRGKTLDLEKLFGVLDTDKVDYTKEKDPWANKFRVAVELGRRIQSPGQCDFIYNGCPLSYEEILGIINEPLKQATTTTTTTTTAAPYTRNMSYAQTHYITLPPPIIMQLPLQHQYQYHQQQPYLTQQSQYHQPVHHQQMHYHHPVNHQQPQYHHQQMQHQHQPQQQLQQHQHHHHHAQPQTEQNHNQNQQLQHSKPESFNDIYAQVLKKPQRATIKQSSPSGEEFHINLLYDSMRKTGVAEQRVETTTVSTTTPEASVEEDDENSSSSSGSSSAGNDDPLSYKVLKYHNNNFLQRPNTVNTYSIRRRNDEKQKPIIMKDVVPVSTTGSGGSNSGSNSAEESMELNPVAPEQSIATDNMIRQQVRPSTVPFTKAEGKYKYKQMLKGAPPPPRRQSSNPKFREQQKRKGNEDIREKSRRKKKTKSSYRNSISRFSNHSKKRKPERLKHHHRLQQKRKQHKHRDLHKQSSVSIGAKNRRKIPASNAIHPVYGHRFPSSYGGHYHKRKPSNQSYLPNNFFNYLFGKPYI